MRGLLCSSGIEEAQDALNADPSGRPSEFSQISDWATSRKFEAVRQKEELWQAGRLVEDQYASTLSFG